MNHSFMHTLHQVVLTKWHKYKFLWPYFFTHMHDTVSPLLYVNINTEVPKARLVLGSPKH